MFRRWNAARYPGTAWGTVAGWTWLEFGTGLAVKEEVCHAGALNTATPRLQFSPPFPNGTGVPGSGLPSSALHRSL